MASPTLSSRNVASNGTLESLNVAMEEDSLLHEAAAGAEASRRGTERLYTMLVVNAASVLEKTDEQLLPSVYKYVNCSFHAGPGARADRLSSARSASRRSANVHCAAEGPC